MCGIAGIVSFKPGSIDIAVSLKSIADVIAHRGPDDEGYFLKGEYETVCAGADSTPEDVWTSSLKYSPARNINELRHDFKLGLAHRRLSILDLSPLGHQPFTYQDSGLWLTFNGEIYNYKELRQELIHKGYSFYTETDTEVLMVSYIEWGVDCVDRFNGMWSFVIYDEPAGKLFGSRDRFGVKPFYYYHSNGIFAFASEQKALVKQSFIHSGINEAAVFDFFVLDQIEYEKEGMFKNIYELFPSHSFNLSLSTGDFKSWKYYSLPVNNSFESFNRDLFNNAVQTTESLLARSVETHLRSDVKVGSCLSGGIDSSVLVGLMNGKSNENIPVYTAVFPGSDIDESHWAEKVVKENHVNWHTVEPTAGDLLKDIQDLIYCQDVPIWSTSTYAQYRVMQLVHSTGVKVILDGQGGDELFGGYDPYHYSLWKQQLSHGNIFDFAGNIHSFGLKRSLSLFLSMQKRKVSSKNPSLNYMLNPEFNLLNKDFRSSHTQRIENVKFYSNLNEHLADEFYNTRLKGYLKCEDRCSMRFSVESRVPFADDKPLIEFVFNTPSSLKIHDGISKYLLREASKSHIPNEIFTRKDKMGYVTPNNKWISQVSPYLEDYFDDTLSNFLDINKIKSSYKNIFSPVNPQETGRLFKFISFAVWHRTFFGQ